MTFQTRESAGDTRIGLHEAGNRPAGSRHHLIGSFITHTARCALAFVIVAAAVAGTGGDAACFIAALCLGPLLAPVHPRPRRRQDAAATEPELPYMPGAVK